MRRLRLEKFMRSSGMKSGPAWPRRRRKYVKILGVESLHSTELCTKAYRVIVTRACHKKNEERVRQNVAEETVICGRIPGDVYGRKEYVDNTHVSNVRQNYRSRFQMMPFAGNYSHDRRFANTDCLCPCRIEKEDDAHLLSDNCQIYGEIREKYGSFNDDGTLIKFFN